MEQSGTENARRRARGCSRSAQLPERSATVERSRQSGVQPAASVPASSAAHDAGVKRSGPRDCIRGGLVAPTPRGEPAVSRELGAMRPPRRERSDRSRGQRTALRHADPPRLRRLRRGREPMGGAGSPPGTLRRTRSRTTVRRPVPRSFGAQAPARAGLHSTGRSDNESGGGCRVRVSCAGANCAARGLENVAIQKR